MENYHKRSGAHNSRRRLPQRRSAIAVELEHAGHSFRMQLGYFADGALGEIFLDARKQNSTLDAVAADAAILISLLLQHGATPAEIGHALRRAPDGTAASLIGAVVDRLVEEGASERGKTTLEVCVNRTPVTAEVGAYREKRDIDRNDPWRPHGEAVSAVLRRLEASRRRQYEGSRR